MGPQHLPTSRHPNPVRKPQLSRAEINALGEQIATHAAHIDAANHALLTNIRTFDREGGWAAQGAKSCVEWLSWRLHWDKNTAREHLRVANRLAELPLIDAAHRRGELSYAKVRALTRVATPGNEQALLTDARYSTGSQLEQITRKYASVLRQRRPSKKHDETQRRITRRDLDDGMVHIEAVLHPEEAQIVWAALTRIAKEKVAQQQAAEDQQLGQAILDKQAAGESLDAEITAANDLRSARTIDRWNGKAIRFSRADALVEMSQDILAGNRPERSPTELIVTVGADALVAADPNAAALGAGLDGTALSIDTIRRLACDCGVVVVHEDEHGKTINVGRKSRSIPAATKRALTKRDQKCRFPGCGRCVYLQGHHAKHWANGGETKLGNLVMICSYHHRFVHEYGYSVRFDENEQPHFFDPSGREILDAPPRPTTNGMVDLREMNRSLAITSTTNAPKWTGDRVDYNAVISALLQQDRAARESAEYANGSAETSAA